MSYVYDPNTTFGITTTPNTLSTTSIYTTSPIMTTGTINWGTSGGAYTIATDPNLKGSSLHVKGDAQFEGDVAFQGDISIKGKAIKEALYVVEKRLATSPPREELEKKWDNLRELRKQYMELEAEIIEKEAMWAILKK